MNSSLAGDREPRASLWCFEQTHLLSSIRAKIRGNFIRRRTIYHVDSAAIRPPVSASDERLSPNSLPTFYCQQRSEGCPGFAGLGPTPRWALQKPTETCQTRQNNSKLYQYYQASVCRYVSETPLKIVSTSSRRSKNKDNGRTNTKVKENKK